MFLVKKMYSFLQFSTTRFSIFLCMVSFVQAQVGASSLQTSVDTESLKSGQLVEQKTNIFLDPRYKKRVSESRKIVTGGVENYPGTVTIVKGRVIKGFVVDQLLDAVSGQTVAVSSIEGANQSFAMRGLRSVGNVAIDGMFMMKRFPGELLHSPLYLAFAVEAAEVLRGPLTSSGMVRPGGSINLILRRPNFNRFAGWLHIQSSPVRNKYAGYVDITGPFGTSTYVKSAGRISIGYMNNAIPGGRPPLRNNTVVVIPSIDFQVGILKSESTFLFQLHRGYLHRGHSIASKDFTAGKTSSQLSFTNNHLESPLVSASRYGDYHNETQIHFYTKFLVDGPKIVTATADHKLDFTGRYRIFRNSKELNETRTYENDPMLGKKPDLRGKVSYKDSNEIHVFNSYGGIGDLESHFVGLDVEYEVSSKVVKNKSKLGVDYFFETVGSSVGARSSELLVPNMEYSKAKGVVPKLLGFKKISDVQMIGSGTPLHNPVSLKTAMLLPTEYDLASAERSYPSAKSSLLGVFFNNQINILNFLTITGGVRGDFVYDHARGDKLAEGVWNWGGSPHIGVVGKVLQNKSFIKSLDVYSGFAMGYNHLTSDSRHLEYVKYGNPERSLQVESGIRTDFKTGFSAAVSGYFLEQDVTQYNANFDPQLSEGTRNPIFTNISGVKNVGIEIDAKGKVWDGVFLGGSYSFSTKISKDSFIKPTPTHSENIWIKYVFEKTYVKGLGARIGVTGQSEIPQAYYTGQGIPSSLPSQFWADVGLSYDTKTLSFNFLVSNFTNNRIWKTVVDNQQAYIRYDGVDLSMSMSVKF